MPPGTIAALLSRICVRSTFFKAFIPPACLIPARTSSRPPVGWGRAGTPEAYPESRFGGGGGGGGGGGPEELGGGGGGGGGGAVPVKGGRGGAVSGPLDGGGGGRFARTGGGGGPLSLAGGGGTSREVDGGSNGAAELGAFGVFGGRGGATFTGGIACA